MKLMVFGAYSAIAVATLRAVVERRPGARLLLVGRRAELLQATAADLMARGAGETTTLVADLGDIGSLPGIAAAALEHMPDPDVLLLAHGTLPNQGEIQDDPTATARAFEVNGLSAIALLAALVPTFATRGRGVVAVVTSVAGDRGRQSNYVYGAAKKAVSVYLAGLRHRLTGSGVRVLDIRPGFVDTPMTAALPKGPLWASVEPVGQRIQSLLERGDGVYYVPRMWSLIMLVVRALPDGLFARTRL